MTTDVLQVDAVNPEPEHIARAAAVIRAGGLVAFPTETVYGLGANALDPAAVGGIFRAKGRPANNPLIVHVAHASAAQGLVLSWPETAQTLARRYWPGPLSLVLPKRPLVPDVATAGAATVALRVPAHPVALALLSAADVPIAAPSANRSMAVSPTRAEHVLRGLRGRIDLVLDGGPTAGGLESTVVDLTVWPPRLLRPGLVTRQQIEAVVGPITVMDAGLPARDVPLASPGMMTRHYAPRATLECLAATDTGNRVRELLSQNLRVGWLTFGRRGDLCSESRPPALLRVFAMPADAAAYSAILYAALHTCDEAGMDFIVVDAPPSGDAWAAIHDRLRRASAVE
jgi:L-threonylcarbamoyladenylate synthase